MGWVKQATFIKNTSRNYLHIDYEGDCGTVDGARRVTDLNGMAQNVRSLDFFNFS